MKKRIITKTRAVAFLAVLAGVGVSHAASITLSNNDALNNSSFNSKGNWNSASAPIAGNTYDTGPYGLRTPTATGVYVFGGDSLTLSAPGTGGAGYSMAYKVNGNATNSANWILNGGYFIHNNSSTQVGTWAGTMNVLPGGVTFDPKQGPFVVSADLSGSGNVTFASSQNNAYSTVTFAGNNSAFTGKMILGNASANPSAIFAGPNAAPGNPSVFTPDQITLQNTLLDNYGIAFNNANGGFTLAGNATINASGTNAPTVISEPITDNGVGFNLIKRGGGVLTLSGNNTFYGGLTLFGITAGGQLNLNSPTAWGYGTFTINSGNNGVLDNTSGSDLALANNNAQVWANSFAFLGSSSLDMGMGYVTMSGSLTVTVSNNNLTVGPVTDSGLGYSLTKAGAGTLTLNGGGSFYGATVVNAGTLAITGGGALNTSPTLTVASNAVLDMTAVEGLSMGFNQILAGNGTVNGQVTDSSSTAIDPGGTNALGTLTINGDLTLNGGGGLFFDLANDTTPGGGTNDLLVVTGTLNLANPITTLQISGTPATGTYTLIKYGSFAGDLANLSVPLGYALNNNISAKTIELVVTHVPASLTWAGDSAGNVWDVATTPNWKQGAATGIDFFTGDSVTFDDTGSASPPIYLSGTISPNTTIVSNGVAHTYDFQGAGIATGSLTKTGPGTLILESANSYAGGTVISNGTVQLGNGGTPGTLGSGPIADNGAIVVSAGSPIVFGAPISGTGSVTVQSGNTTLSASNSYTGPTSISGATLFVQNGSALGATNGGTVVNPGGQLFINSAINIGEEPLSLSGIGDGSGALRKSGGNVGSFGGPITLAGDTTMKVDGSGTLNLTNVAGINGSAVNANLTLNGDGGSAGNISGPLALGTGGITVSSSGSWAFNSPNTFSGFTLAAGVVNANTNGVFYTNAIVANGSSGRIVLGTGTTLTNSVTVSSPAPGVATGFLMVNDNTNGAVTTISGPMEFDNTPGNGNNFYGPTSSGYLNVTGPVTNLVTGVIGSRNGFVRFSGGGDYTTFNLNQGTASIGVNNGLCTKALLALSQSGAATFDLNGFNQTLTGLSDSGAGGLVTNSSPGLNTLTLNLSSSSIYTNTIGGNLALVLNGPGYQSLGGSNSYTGNTTVNGGTLDIAQPYLAAGSTITVASGAMLQLDFTTTNVIHGLVLGGTSITAGVHNSNTDPSYLSGSGSLLVQPVADNPTNIVFSANGSMLGLSWPGDHQGWYVQSNSVDVANPSDWFDIPGSQNTTNLNITVDPSKNVFFRLRKP